MVQRLIIETLINLSPSYNIKHRASSLCEEILLLLSQFEHNERREGDGEGWMNNPREYKTILWRFAWLQ